jgi:hypothetical protein
MFNILKYHKIIGYFRYVDDILMIYKEDQTDIQEVPDQFSRSFSHDFKNY